MSMSCITFDQRRWIRSPSLFGSCDLRFFAFSFCIIFVKVTCQLQGGACPPCGNFSVPYPLSTFRVCGQPSYGVRCSSQGQLQLQTISGTYSIAEISASSRKLYLTPPAVNSSCDSPEVNVGGLKLNPSLPFNITSANTIMLFNCSPILLLSPLDCSNSSLCRSYLNYVLPSSPCQNHMCCAFVPGSTSAYGFELNYAGCTAYTSAVNLIRTDPAKIWKYLIEVEWKAPSEPSCSSTNDCQIGSSCKLDSATGGFKCLCDGGLQWSADTGTCDSGGDSCGGTNRPRCGSKLNIVGLSTGVSCSLAAIFAAGFGFSILWRKELRRQKEARRQKQMSLLMSVGSGAKPGRMFTSHEMRKATSGFAKNMLLGSGGFGDVFKGTLENGTPIAVKVAKLDNIRGTEHVINEVSILSQVNHRNLVRLLGCCVDMKQPLLIYEYVPNGNLLEHLNGSRGKFLDWKTRLQIAFQTAEALAYLHSAANPPIYHRDVKSSNILLDMWLNAKVSDFGLSRLASLEQTHLSTCAQGTLGYLDPEYYRTYRLTDKSDVYSFGVVLLELVTAQRVIDFSRGTDDANLAIFVMRKEEDDCLVDVIDPQIKRDCHYVTSLTAIIDVIQVALSCLRDGRLDRPSMTEVVEKLRQIMNSESLDSCSGDIASDIDEYLR